MTMTKTLRRSDFNPHHRRCFTHAQRTMHTHTHTSPQQNTGPILSATPPEDAICREASGPAIDYICLAYTADSNSGAGVLVPLGIFALISSRRSEAAFALATYYARRRCKCKSETRPATMTHGCEERRGEQKGRGSADLTGPDSEQVWTVDCGLWNRERCVK